ncbi:hypothetical protein [Micromonospora violae]|uniref:hypothetical protein n=1 Tax=Micromonospora violae TaxID=1278207 RepID=UPI0033D47D76
MAPAQPTSTHPAQPQPFTPIVIQAEDPRNDLRGGAQVVACGQCDAGARVRYIGGPNQLVVRATMPVAGLRTVTVTYESDGRRSLLISVNNAAPRVCWVNGGGDWETPATFSFSTYLPAGPVELTFYQEGDPAPDVDSIAIR